MVFTLSLLMSANTFQQNIRSSKYKKFLATSVYRSTLKKKGSYGECFFKEFDSILVYLKR